MYVYNTLYFADPVTKGTAFKTLLAIYAFYIYHWSIPKQLKWSAKCKKVNLTCLAGF